MQPPRPRLTGVHHVTLTVTDVDRSAGWYAATLGFERFADRSDEHFHRCALRHPDMPVLLTLIAHRAAPGGPFDERRTGLDHLAFRVASPEDVAAWRSWLVAQEVDCSEAKDGALPGSRLITFRDPDGIQLECYFRD